jgi:hypothetical protein
MAIVIRNNGGKWQRATIVKFADEAQLQELLYKSPELIPTSYDEDEPAVFIREAGLSGCGYTDLLGVDAHGNILVIETKLARNEEIRRKVIGQVLEYAAYLWRMDFEDFDALFLKKTERHLLDLLEERIPGIVRDEMQNAIVRNLSSGAFQLFIAVDEMNDELEKIISYVSSRGSGLRLEVLEFALHQSGQIEIIVPTRYGQLSTPDSAGTTPPVKTIEELVATISNEENKRMFLLLLKLWQDAGNPVKTTRIGVAFQAKIGDKVRPIFWAYANNLQNALGEISRHGAPEGPLKNYRQQIGSLPGFNPKALSEPNPITKYSNISEDEIQKFVSFSLELVNDWRSALTSMPA